jgi:TP901 family phage tail tape measure protein
VGLGLAVALPLKSAVEAFEEEEDHLASLGAALGNATDKVKQLAAAQEFVDKEAIATGYSVGQLTDSLYQGISGFLKMDQAMAVTTDAAKVGRATHGDVIETTKTLATMMLNFGDAQKTPIENAGMLADKLTAIQTQGKWSNLTDLQEGLKYAAPAMNAFGISLNQGLSALSAWSAAGVDASSSGEAFLEVVSQLAKHSDKLGIKVLYNAAGGTDLLATVQEIAEKFGNMPRGQLGALLTGAFGERAGPRLIDLIDKMQQFKEATDIAAHSAGATDVAYSEFTKRGTLAFKQFGEAMEVFKERVGGALAPLIERITPQLTRMADALSHFAKVYPNILKAVTVFLAVGAALAIVVGGLIAAVGGLAMLAGALGITGTALLIIGAIGAAISAVIAIWVTWGPQIAKFFSTTIPEAFHWGVDLMKALGAGIWSAITWPVRAAEHVAERIKKFFVGHSPPPLGPLHDLNKVRIVETIAQTIQPAPMLAAIRRVAAVTAIAAPMMIGVGAMPAMAAGPAGARAAPIVVNVTYAPVINGAGSADEFEQSARKHARELARIIEEVLARKDRTKF